MTADPLLGRTLAGFTLEALIGKGGMGVVYRAEQPRLGRKVALKVLSPELAGNAEFRSRFLAESRTAASIDHPNILPVFDAGEEGGLLYIAMRLVEGEHTDLQALLEREGALRPERALAIVSQVASALDAAHARGLVHRDVKPGNVLLAGDHAYLTDFGIAKVQSGRRELTRTGAFLGTLDYASPEQIRNEAVDGASDIYALGALLFHCLTGKVPFDRPSDYGVMRAHLEEPPLRVSGDLPLGLDAVFATAMAKVPDERYRSGRHLVEAARAALAGEAVSGPVPPGRTTVLAQPPPVAPTMVATPDAVSRQPTTTAKPRARPKWLFRYSAFFGAVVLLLVAKIVADAVTAPPAPAPTPTLAPTPTVVVVQVVTASPTATPTAISSATPTLAPERPSVLSLGCPSSVLAGATFRCVADVRKAASTVSFLWIAHDGNPDRGFQLTFDSRFTSAGTRTVSLTACNDLLVCDSTQQTISVQSPTPIPTASPGPVTPTAGAGPVPSISVSPPVVQLAVGTTQQFTATTNLTGTVSWSVLGGCGTITAAGLFVPTAATTSQFCTVRASIGTIAADASVTVAAVASRATEVFGVVRWYGQPVAGATVELANVCDGTSAALRSTTTASDGSYSLGNVSLGTYTVRWRNPSDLYDGGTQSVAYWCQVTPGTSWDHNLLRHVTLRQPVTNNNVATVASTFVLTWDSFPGATRYRTLDSGGSGLLNAVTTSTSFTFVNVPPGTYNVMVQAFAPGISTCSYSAYDGDCEIARGSGGIVVR